MAKPEYAVFEKDREVRVSDGTPIRYTVRGPENGIAIVLANGWSCSDAYPEATHCLPIEETESLGDAIHRFVQRVAPKTPAKTGAGS